MNKGKVEALWARAEEEEANGSLDAARELYIAILAAGVRPIMAKLRLSRIEQRAGRYLASRSHAIGAAIALKQANRLEALPFVAQRLLEFDELPLIASLIVEADWRDPRVVAQAPALSQLLSLAGHFQEGLTLLDTATARAGRNHLLCYSRANIFRDVGRMDEATSAFEQCIELAPSFAYAHWALASHARAEEKGMRVNRIQAAIEPNRGDPLAEAHLHYALFKEFDDAGQTDNAWTALMEGASIMRALCGYEAPSEVENVEALHFSPVMPDYERDEDEVIPIFIVGMPRTGTTVLERILGSHSQVSDGGELNAMQHSISMELDSFIQLPLSAADLTAPTALNLRSLARQYQQRTRHLLRGKKYFVDKNPKNVFCAGIIAAAFKQARILCLMRDPMDSCFSNLKELFPGGGYGYSYDFADLAGHYFRFRCAVEHYQNVMPDQFMTVKYEALVADPEATSRHIMSFCGLSYEEACIEIASNASPSSTASASQVREPIHTRNVNAWRKYESKLAPLASELRSLRVVV
jgi:tetratricopeptide (TPR) repeat protein